MEQRNCKHDKVHKDDKTKVIKFKTPAITSRCTNNKITKFVPLKGTPSAQQSPHKTPPNLLHHSPKRTETIIIFANMPSPT